MQVQTTAAIALGSTLCGETLDNTAFAVADNADQVSDGASINVICGAIQVNKSVKVPGTEANHWRAVTSRSSTMGTP